MTTTTRTFTRDELVGEYDLPRRSGTAPAGGCTVISDEIDDTTRWSVLHTLTFRLADQPECAAWSVGYSVGATEQQDESPWEHEPEVTATLMRAVAKTVTVWEPAMAPAESETP